MLTSWCAEVARVSLWPAVDLLRVVLSRNRRSSFFVPSGSPFLRLCRPGVRFLLRSSVSSWSSFFSCWLRFSVEFRSQDSWRRCVSSILEFRSVRIVWCCAILSLVFCLSRSVQRAESGVIVSITCKSADLSLRTHNLSSVNSRLSIGLVTSSSA